MNKCSNHTSSAHTWMVTLIHVHVKAPYRGGSRNLSWGGGGQVGSGVTIKVVGGQEHN